jgi:hypothetical protein
MVVASVWLCAAELPSPTQAICGPNDTGPHPAGHVGTEGPFVGLTQNPFSNVWPAGQKSDWAATGPDGQQIICNSNNPKTNIGLFRPMIDTFCTPALLSLSFAFQIDQIIPLKNFLTCIVVTFD